MARKVYVNVKVKLIINLEDGETVDEAIQKMDYNFDYRPDNAENRVVDTEILEYKLLTQNNLQLFSLKSV